MTRASRNLRSTLPVNRTIVSGNSAPNKDSSIPLTGLTAVNLQGQAIRKGRSNGQHVGMWGLLSQNFKTSVTIDQRWSHTVTNHG